MSYVVDAAEFDNGWATTVDILCLLSTTLVLYGLYVPMFIFSIQSLTHRTAPGRRVMLGTTVLMFILGTCGTLVNIAEAALVMGIAKGFIQGSPDVPRLDEGLRRFQLTGAALFGVNNLVTDLLFLYRCYLIWGSRKMVLILPGLCILTTAVLTVLDWITHRHSQVYLIQDVRAPFYMTLATNLLLMFLAGGRIWYVGRQVQIVHHEGFRKQYHTALALLLESGAIYCICLVLWIISLSTNLGLSLDSGSILSGVAGALVGQSMNIAPTLILVRVGRGHWRWIKDDAPPSRSGPSGSRVVFKSAETSSPVIEIK